MRILRVINIDWAKLLLPNNRKKPIGGGGAVLRSTEALQISENIIAKLEL